MTRSKRKWILWISMYIMENIWLVDLMKRIKHLRSLDVNEKVI